MKFLKAPAPRNAETYSGIRSFSAPFIAFEHAKSHTVGMTKKDSHEAYIATAPEQFRPMLSRLRAQLSRALPDAEEVIKYDMPGYQIEETIVAGYAAFSRQCGLYVDPAAIAAHADEIASLKLKATKTGVTFSVSNPITDELVEKLAASSRSKKGF
ncbi:iron chaperone [Mesorhizobium amorphae]